VLLPALGFPISLFYVASGAVFAPPALALAVAWVCMALNMALSYGIAHWLARPVQALIRRRGLPLPQLGGATEWRVIVLLRASPLPYLMQSWLLAIGGARFGPYMVYGLPVQALIGAGLVARKLNLGTDPVQPSRIADAVLLELDLLDPTVSPRFALPKDLGYGLATMANPHGFQARRLPSASPWKLLFSRRAERAITDRDGELLGWVRPEDDELYGLRPAPGVEVVDPQGKVLQPESGVALLQVHQTYRLRSSKGELVFRMQYL